LCLYLLFRAGLLLTPGYGDDLRAYKRWAVAAATHGVSRVYRESDMDYPPLYVYLLAPLGHVHEATKPGARARANPRDSSLWTILVKLPPLAFDLLTAALLRRFGGAYGPSWEWLLPAAYLLNPAVWFDTGHWGHPDSILGFFVLASLLALGAGRPRLGCASLALATLMKPLGAPFAPLLVAFTWLRHGPAAALRGSLAAVAVVLAAFLPFLAAGEGRTVLERIVADVDRMPYTSVNAHNLWWLMGPWRSAEAPFVGPLSATQLGLVAFGCVYALVLVRVLPRAAGADAATATRLLISAAAAIAFAFFMLSTHMHENHLFVALPLLCSLLPCGREYRWLFAAVSAGVLLNLVLHDPAIPERWPFTLGGESGVPRPSHGRSFYWFELLCVRLGAVWNAIAFGAALAFLLRARAAPSRLASPPGRREDHRFQ
jgi:hypothetical protein